ncbi:MAG: extracellular solute-binding protein [Chloroflexi bacterium]|nr:extracellular solute-binding protein [Chloroflexota bacterium]
MSLRHRSMAVALCGLLIAGAGISVARASRVLRNAVVVQYWENLCWSPAKQDLQTMIDAFNRSHPSIQLQPRCFSNANQLQPTLLAAIHQHHPPALSQTDAFAVATYVDQKAVQDLTPYIHGRNGLNPGEIRDFFPPQWQNGMYHGRMYSLPFNDTSVTVMWYNPKILASSHITTLPRTWSQFAADCAQVTRGGNWCMDTTDNEETLWEPMVRQWGGQLVNASGTRAAFDSPAGAGALQFWVNLVKKGYVHHTNSSTSQWQQDFASGHVAFEVYSSEGAAATQQLIGPKFTMGAAEMPAGPRSNVDGNAGDNIFMFKGASPAVKDAAWAYMKWATQPRWTAWWSEQLDASPVRQSAVRLMSRYLRTHPLAAIPIKELGRAYFSPTVSGWAQAQGDIDTEMSKAMLGQESSNQAMKNSTVKVNHDIATAG